MIGDMATALLAVTTTVKTERTILVAITGIMTLATRGEAMVTQISISMGIIIAIPVMMETIISSQITKKIILGIRIPKHMDKLKVATENKLRQESMRTSIIKTE